MIKAFVTLQCKKLWSSYTLIPPYLIFILWIILLYFYSGQGVDSSYSLSVVVLFIITMWLTKIVLQMNTNVEKHLFYIQLNNKMTYLYLNMLVCMIVAVPLIIFSLVYPIIFNFFEPTITIKQLILAIILNLLIVLLSILTTTLVLTVSLHSKKLQWLILFLLVILVFVKDVVSHQSIYGKWLDWLLPPVTQLTYLLTFEEGMFITYLLCRVFIYMIILIVCIKIANHKIEVI